MIVLIGFLLNFILFTLSHFCAFRHIGGFFFHDANIDIFSNVAKKKYEFRNV